MAPIFELFCPTRHAELTERISQACRESFSERTLRGRWLELGGSSLVREGLRLAASGQITHAEVLKHELLSSTA